MNGWVNLEGYTAQELALFGTGGFCWVAAYAVLLARSRRLRWVEMPVVAACSNFAWEALWSLVFRTNMGRLFELCYLAWLVLDLFIFWNVIAYGDQQVELPFLKRHFKPLALIFTAFVGLTYFAFIRQGLDDAIGARTAYIGQLAISLPYYCMLANPEQRRRLSASIAWLRSLGTGLITLYVYLHSSADLFLLVLSTSSLLLDAGFLALFHRLRAKYAEQVVLLPSSP
jgi:hypothetical protein